MAIMAAMVSCSMEQEPATVETNKVSATADDFKYAEAFTRTTITQSGSSAPTFAWKAGDVIGVIPMDNETVQSNYKISKIDSDPKTATFDGGVWALKEGKGYAAYYPYSEVVARKNSKLEFSFLGQTQTANNSLEHISAYDYMYAPAVTASSSTTAFNFSHLVSLVRVQVTVPQADEYTSLVLESSAAWFAGKAELSLAEGTMTSTQSLKSCTIALDNISVSAGGVLTVWFATLPTSALDGVSLTAKLYGKNTNSTIDITGLKTFEAGKAYSFSCSAGSPSAGGMEYVDLGLSVKWATCNLGASNPEEYGDYYAWGDIETYYEDGCEHCQGAVAVLFSNDCNHADTHVEGLFHFFAGNLAHRGDGAEDLAWGPSCSGHFCDESFWDNPLEVACEAAAGDVAEGVNFALCDQCQAVLGVDAGWLEKFFAEGASEFFDVSVKRQACLFQEDVASQGVTVGVQTGGSHADEDVACADAVWP